MRFKKAIAALTSCIMLLSAAALPASTAATVFAASNLISNSTFDSGVSSWGMYKESGGAAKLTSDSGRLALNVESVGKLTYAVQMFYDKAIPLYKNGVYHLSYEISSTQDRFIEGMVQQNGGKYVAYTWKGINVTSEPQKVDYEFEMEYDSDIMAKLVFNCGVHEKEDKGVTDYPAHTIYLDNVVLELVDDSKVDYSADKPYEPDIVANQIGYKPNDVKKAIVRGGTSNKFSVVDFGTDPMNVVYTGELSSEISNTGAGETDRIADFSSVTKPGTYFITCDGCDNSYKFEISENPYKNLLDAEVRMMYLQRCGVEINDKDFKHPACHTTKAKVYGTNDTIDVSGGWHDAGDYGRYVVPAAKTIADMLNAYDTDPSLFGDDIGIPESGNGTPDILDEVKFALDWMFKMQDSSTGGVHHKVTCENFPGYVMPQEEKGELIVTPVTTTATADFCASMALAYTHFKKTDKTYAEKCLAAAKKAWDYLEANPQMDCFNPPDITTGDYKDQKNSDKDERYWAAAQLYSATGDSKYLTAVEGMTVQTGNGWSEVGDYGSIAILKSDIDKNSSVYTKAKDSILSQAASFAKTTAGNPYGAGVSKFRWGSNMDVANVGMILALADKISNSGDYMESAKENLFYLMGRNPNAACFVTGFGTVSPQTPHHRPSMAVGKAMPGMLVGGVDSALEDDAAKAYLVDTPPHKCWVDNAESYSTNEVTTYWNSPMIYLIALTNSDSGSATPVTPTDPTTKPTKPKTTTTTEPPIPSQEVTEKLGDVNGDGNVNAADIVLLQKYLVNKAKFSKSQGKNADMNKDGKVNVSDATLLRRTVLSGSSDKPVDPNPVNGNEPDMTADMIADFRKGESEYFFASDGWTNGSCFDCGWYKQNTSLDGGVLSLTIDKDHSGKYNYSGAEYRTVDFYGYGYYETSMMAIKNDGVVSSFFTYTGPSDDNPWDEIDIEILGKDTTKAQFNYYTNGQGNHEFMYDLGFDASEGYHKYGFNWQPDSITWYVDGKEVYKATASIPVTPGKIMMNVWPGITVDDWLKPFNGNTPLTAKYEWVTYKKSGNGNTPVVTTAATTKATTKNTTKTTTKATTTTTKATTATTKATTTTTKATTTTTQQDKNGPDMSADMIADFRKGESKYFFASDGWTNGSCFDCGWYKQNTSLDGGVLSLTIDKDHSGKYHYSGAEYRTNDFYGYGYYETSMKAIKNDGVVSSFFTYTGESDKNPWDEIDIEVLGKDSTKVQFNYYTNGKGDHEFMYDLGFDASQGFHRYGFEWRSDHITWYVDGKAVYTARENIPVTPGKIMMNVWPGITVDDWLKPFNGNTPLTAQYEWVTYKK